MPIVQISGKGSIHKIGSFLMPKNKEVYAMARAHAPKVTTKN